MSALFPDVPNVSGVPQVLRDAANSALDNIGTQLTGDSADLTVDPSPQWGIFDADGADQVIVPDSIVSFEYAKEEQISTFPVEQGGFQSYNKVETPYSVRLTLTKGGSKDDRTSFLDQCQTLLTSTDLYTVLTPETSYSDANITRVSLQRSADRGAQLLTVEMVIEEVRSSATSQFTKSNTQDPASADQTNDGSVQTQTPTAAQTPQGQPL